MIIPVYQGRKPGLGTWEVMSSLCVPQLEAGHSGRLEKTEDLWLKVRKDHAPRLARLSLESRSLQDVLLHRESLCFHTYIEGGFWVTFSRSALENPGVRSGFLAELPKRSLTCV